MKILLFSVFIFANYFWCFFDFSSQFFVFFASAFWCEIKIDFVCHHLDSDILVIFSKSSHKSLLLSLFVFNSLYYLLILLYSLIPTVLSCLLFLFFPTTKFSSLLHLFPSCFLRRWVAHLIWLYNILRQESSIWFVTILWWISIL